MATEWISPTWRMPEESNQSKFDNYSLDFDGSNEYIDCGNDSSLNITSNITLSAWVKPTTAITSQNFPMFIAKGLNCYMLFGNSPTGGVRFRLSGSVLIDSDSTIPTNEWTHVVGTYDGSNLRIYLNGSLDKTVSHTGAIPVTTDNVQIGAANTGNKFDGEISQVSIFDYALSQGQIDYLYNSGTPQNPMAISGNAPIAYYPLGGSSTGSSSTLTTPNESVPSATVFDFDRSNSEYIDLDPGVMKDFTSDNVSISAWVKADAFNAYDYIFVDGYTSGNKIVALSYASVRGGLEFTVGNGSVARASGVSINTGEWYHIVCTYAAGGDLKFYLNGNTTPVATATFSGALDLSSHTKSSIGRSNVHSANYWDGEISNVQVWNAELETSDVTTLYNNGVPLLTGTQPQAANLKGWWKLNVDTSNWNGTDWLLSNSSITPTYTEGLFFGGGYIGGSPVANYAGMSLTNQTISSENVTYSFWYKRVLPTTGSSTAMVKTAGYLGGVNVLSSGMVQWSGDGAAKYINFSGNLVADGAWHHILIYYPNTSTITHSDVKCYINGSLQTNSYIGGSSSSGPVTSIRGTLIQSVPMNVELSNWAYFLTNQTGNINTIYNGGTPGDISSLNPSVWLKYDSATTAFAGATGANYGLATDSSGNSNNGNLAGRTDGTTTKLVTSNVQSGDGVSNGMTTANLVNSDLTRSIPYSSYSMDFDGTADYINCGTSSDLEITGDVSISAWVYITTGSAYQGIVSKRDSGGTNYQLYTDNSATPKLRFYDGSTATSSTGTVSLNAWHHIAITIDSGVTDGSIFYIDGVASGTATFTITSNDASLIIGAIDTGSFGSYFSGSLSNTAVFNSVLSQDRILTIYNGGVPNNISSLSPVSWWSLAGDSYFDGNDWICPDLGSGSNNGTSANMSGTELVGDGPGSTANGIGSSMNIPANLKGNAPNSSKNAFSVNMNSADRVADVPA